MTEFSTRNFFSWPLTHSTCIRTCAICLVMSTSFADICNFPREKAGILRTDPWFPNCSYIKNPLSARKQPINVILSKKPDFTVISLSEALPPQSSDKKANSV